MSRYEYSRTNGSYSGLSRFYGLGDGRGDGKGRGKGEGGGGGVFYPMMKSLAKMPVPRPSAPRKMPPTPKLPPAARAEILDQKAIFNEKRAEIIQKKADAAMTSGNDAIAQALMAKASMIDKKADFQQAKAASLRLPYADDPMVPKAIIQEANAAAVDNPIAIADQTAPDVSPNMSSLLTSIATSEPVMGPAETTQAVQAEAPPSMAQPPVQTTAPVRFLMPPPMPMMARGPMGPMGPMPMAMGPAPQMRGPGFLANVSRGNLAAGAAALAASYFLFF